MATRNRTASPAASTLEGIWAILLLAFVVTALYFGRAVFVPLALAILITFLLSRLATRMERRIGRLPAVLLIVILLFSLAGATSWMVGRQVVDLAGKLPEYQANITRKLHSVRLPAIGLFSQVSSSVNALQNELVSPSPTPSPTESASESLQKSTPPGAKPVPVKVIEGRNAIPQLLQETITAVLSPLGTGALVLLLVIFMLLKREDLRGRMIRLIGQGRISATTRAMDDAAARVSRYLSMQFLVNTCYGFLIAIGLHLIGVPNAALWGLLAGILRFVPYVGPWAGALLPVLLALAISTNWITPLLTMALFIALEVTISNFIEPWLYGASTGVSPIALIISAVFWTWLWGPIGLVLSTPITVCLAVMGRHAPRLEFLGVLLSEDHALAPHEEFFHRLLAIGTEGAEDFAETFTTAHSLTELYDQVIIPAITRAEMDAQNGGLDAEQRTSILQRIHDIVEDLEDLGADRFKQLVAEDQKLAEPPIQGTRVICVPASAYRDELAGEMLVQLLLRHGCDAANTAARLKEEELLDQVIKFDPELLCISIVTPSTLTRARHLGGTFRERFPELRILVGAWNAANNLANAKERLRAAGMDEVVTSLAEAVLQVSKMTAPLPDEMMMAPKAANEEERLEELRGLKLLDTPAEENFDRITQRLTRLFRVPVALLTLIDRDRQWFKAYTGLPADLADARSTSRDVSLCDHVVARDDILIVRDLARDPRFANNPFIKERGFRFYAGAPLRGPNGLPIGSLCILDTKPRDMSRQEQDLLQVVAEDIMDEIKRRPVTDADRASENRKT